MSAVPPLRHSSLIGCELIYYAMTHSMTRGNFDFFARHPNCSASVQSGRNANRYAGMRVAPTTIRTEKKPVKNYYGSLCTEMYEFLHCHASEEELAFYLSYAKEGMRILEPLCGSGQSSFPLCKRGFDIQGVDSSRESSKSSGGRRLTHTSSNATS